MRVFRVEPFSAEERKELWRQINRHPDGSTYGEHDLARYEKTVQALHAELDALRSALVTLQRAAVATPLDWRMVNRIVGKVLKP